MRYNIFAPQGDAGYGLLVCSVCNKNVTFEMEQQAELSTYGEGARVLNMLGSPKPPNLKRRKAGDASQDDNTI